MSATTETAARLNDVVAIMRDGVHFYDEAIEAVDNTALNAVLRRYRDAKKLLASDLSSAVALRGDEPEGDGTFVGSMREGYAKLKASFGDTSRSFVDELEEHEDQALHKVEDLIKAEDTPAEAKRVLNTVYPEIKALHDDMRDIKQQFDA